MRAVRGRSVDGEWHTPLLQEDEAALDVEIRKQISAARCARVSYLTHEGVREIAKDLELYERLKSDRHLSPFEHVATPSDDRGFHANFRGWIQMRSEVEALGSMRGQAPPASAAHVGSLTTNQSGSRVARPSA